MNERVVEWANEWAERGVPIVLASNQEHRRAGYLLKNLRAIVPVAELIYSAELGFAKPQPQFYVAANYALSNTVGNARVIFLDDATENVEAARFIGWTGVHFDASGAWIPVVEQELRQTLRAR